MSITALEYEVKPAPPTDLLPEGGYQATTPYRHIVWLGATEKEAIGSMLYGLCDLVKRGCLDPDAPGPVIGDPPAGDKDFG
jgi:hypothetical protein